MTARVEMLAGGAPPEPECFRPTALQRYGLWIEFLLSPPFIIVILLWLAPFYPAHPQTEGAWAWVLWWTPLAILGAFRFYLTSPLLPTPTALGRSKPLATFQWTAGLALCCIGYYATVLGMVYSLLLSLLGILLIAVGTASTRSYDSRSGWSLVRLSGFRIPPREWQMRQPRAKKPGGARAG
jgi:hypothetical protein